MIHAATTPMKKLQQPHNPTRPTSIIALFARGREIGFVILENGKIVRYGVKTIKGKKQGSDLTRRVERILAPVLAMAGLHSVIVIERDAELSRKGALCKAIHHLAGQWRRQNYRVRPVSWAEVVRTLCEGRRATQREVAQAILEQHPLLWQLVRQSTAYRAKYWKKVLLAAALAEVIRQR